MREQPVRPFRVASSSVVSAALMFCTVTYARADQNNLADNPKFYAQDLNKIVITDIVGWSHPTKAVFKKYKLKLTKVELLWNKKFPVFHVADFGADPGAGPASTFFDPLEWDLLKANGNNAYKIVEDNTHDGFVVAYDKRTHGIDRDLVQGESP